MLEHEQSKGKHDAPILAHSDTSEHPFEAIRQIKIGEETRPLLLLLPLLFVALDDDLFVLDERTTRTRRVRQHRSVIVRLCRSWALAETSFTANGRDRRRTRREGLENVFVHGLYGQIWRTKGHRQSEGARTKGWRMKATHDAVPRVGAKHPKGIRPGSGNGEQRREG